jgi:hypothetical protein
MQHMYDVEWYGKTVRLYITKIEKLDWVGRSWETKYVLMAKKDWEDVIDGGNGMPSHLFHKDVALSDEYSSLEELTKALTIARIAAEKTFRLNYGDVKPQNLDWAFLDIFKFAKVHPLDPEIAKEKATEDMPQTIVGLCLSKNQEKDLDEFEAEYSMARDRMDLSSSYMDPHYDPPPAYRKES